MKIHLTIRVDTWEQIWFQFGITLVPAWYQLHANLIPVWYQLGSNLAPTCVCRPKVVPGRPD